MRRAALGILWSCGKQVFLFEYAIFFAFFFPEHKAEASAEWLTEPSELGHLEYPTCDFTPSGIFSLPYRRQVSALQNK